MLAYFSLYEYLMREGMKKRSWSRKSLLVVLSLVVFLVIARLALPYVVLHYANRTLENMNGYRGHIDDIDIALFRGAYKIDSIYLHKYDSVSGKETPFFSASLIDLSVEWHALFHGSIVGELEFDKPVLRFTKDKVEPKDVQADSTDFRKLLDDFMPLQVNRFQINEGDIRYIDQTSKPKVDIAMTDVYLVAHNLKNSYDSAVVLPATVSASAKVYEGTLTFNMKMNPLAEQPTFDMNAELRNTNLVLLNEFFQAYAKVDVNKGTFGLYTEVAAKDGAFTGYVKPLVKDLDVLGHEDRDDNIFQKAWEAIAGATGKIFRNQPKDQVATKIPFQGRLDDPHANIWITISNTLQNAFIRAIQPSLDHEINLASVDEKQAEKETLLQKVFGKEDKKMSRKEERKAKRKARKEERDRKKHRG